MISESHQLRARNPMFHLMPKYAQMIADEISKAQVRGEILENANPLDLAVMLNSMIKGQFMSRIYKNLKAQTNQPTEEYIDECVVETLKVRDDATTETLVISMTDLIFTVFFEGIRKRGAEDE